MLVKYDREVVFQSSKTHGHRHFSAFSYSVNGVSLVCVDCPHPSQCLGGHSALH